MPTKLAQFITIPNNSGKVQPNGINESSSCLLCDFAPPTGGVNPGPQLMRKIQLGLWQKIWKIFGPQDE
jgi:hypothetical protein